MLAYMVVYAPQLPVLGTLLSERTKPEDQGAMLGINQSYQSVGQVIGPLLAGVVATQHPSLVFVLCAGIFGVAVIASRWLFVPVRGKANL
jgi:MFS family permease